MRFEEAQIFRYKFLLYRKEKFINKRVKKQNVTKSLDMSMFGSTDSIIYDAVWKK